MTRFHTVLATVLLTGGTIFAQSAAAQYNYIPQRPTISPWMNLFQGNTGPLDNYHTFVRPQIQLNRTLQMQSTALNRQAAGLQYLNNEIMEPQGNQSTMLSTGQGATFMNYSHYYGGNQQASYSAAPRLAAPRKSTNLPSYLGMPQ